MAIDMEQFHQVFFEESLEGLDVMEHSLLSISSGGSDSETINTIFRAAHSLKGGSGTFGFSDVADFTHVLETLLDEVRDGQRVLTEELIELLLQSTDCLRHMIVGLQNKQPVDSSLALPLISAFEAVLKGGASDGGEAVVDQNPASPKKHNDILMESLDVLLTENGNVSSEDDGKKSTGEKSNEAGWIIEFAPQPQILLTGNEPLRIFRELATLGQLKVEADISAIPELAQLHPDECFISWTLQLAGSVKKEDIIEVFEWVIDECKLEVRRSEDSASVEVEEPKKSEEGYTEPQLLPPEQAVSSAVPAQAKKVDTSAANASTSSIRVGIDKVDSLINLVGELVITQSMLSELGSNFEMDRLERLSQGLDQLLQNTKELQESVMRIRMLPISFAFNRFPRMIRDMSAKTGKKIDLVLKGEQTELDKTVMEQISDPLVHLVRNAIDHGVESAEVRVAKGKPETGVVTLDAYHQGGNIVIEISDDGSGIDAEKVLAKAREKGLVERSEVLSEQRIFDLIFEPGFSTAAVVSDISGRGVGMDVVRRNIKSLGGRIEIESTLGIGSTFKVYLPLTLAILDGQLVKVGKETYIIPLISIVESLQIKSEHVNRVSGNMALYRLRDENVPIIPVYMEFGVEAETTELDNALLVVVEGEGQKIGLLVDDLLAQQQVVIKSLESNYMHVEGISGATILGDGSVALIIDVSGMIQLASRRSHERAA